MSRASYVQLFKGYPGRMLVLLTLASVVVRIGQSVLPPLLPTIIVDLSISSTEAGIALSLMSVTYGLAQFPSGRLSDQLSRKTVLVVSLCLALVGTLMLSTSATYAMFVIGVVVLGAGRGLFPTPARALLSELFTDRRGQAFGIHLISSDFGGVGAAGLAIVVLGITTWRAAFVPIAVLLLPFAILLQLWIRGAFTLERVTFDPRQTGSRILFESRLRRLLIAYSLFMFTVRGVVGFLPTLLQADQEVSPAVASGVYALLYVCGMVIKPIAGSISDRFPRQVIGGGTLLISAVGMCIILFGGSLVALGIGVVAYAVGHKSYAPVIQAHLMDQFAEESMGSDLGGFRTIYMVVGSLGPIYVGTVASRASYTVAFAGFVACLLITGVITLHPATVKE